MRSSEKTPRVFFNSFCFLNFLLKLDTVSVPFIPALERQRQQIPKFEASLVYIVNF